MAKLQEVRKTIEASLGNLTTVRAQELATGMLVKDAAKEQVSKTATDLMDWSQRNRARLVALIRSEVRDQMKQAGVATEEEVRALRKRVRELERVVKADAKTTAPKRKASGKSAATKKTAARADVPDA